MFLSRSDTGSTSERLDDIQAAELDLDRDLADYPDLRFALQYWTDKRGDRFAPARADIEPGEVIEILPRVMLADVITAADGAVSFRYRLTGTGICSVHGLEFTGQSPLALKPPHYGRLIDAHYRTAVERRSPMAHLIALKTDKKLRSYARIILPLSADGERVNMLMTIDSEARNSLKEFLETIEAIGQRS